MGATETGAAAKKTAAAKKAETPTPAAATTGGPQTATAPQPQVSTPQPAGADGAAKPPADPADPDKRADQADQQLAELRAKLGLPDDANEGTILGALLVKAEADAADRAAVAAADTAVSDVDDLTVPTEGDVECRVKVRISGLRNGIAWPSVKSRVYLPVAEAAQYVALGYVDVVVPLPDGE